MKLVSYRIDGDSAVGILTGAGIANARAALVRRRMRSGEPHSQDSASALDSDDMVDLLKAGLAPLAELTGDDLRDVIPLDEATLLAPVTRPGKIIGVGRNYGKHAKEAGFDLPEQPRLFAKFSTSLAGPHDPVRKPARVTKLDWEVELAVVVGRRMRDVPVERALDYVAGYMVLNDMSAREFQFDIKPAQTTFAKSMDGFCPTGPCLVTPDEMPDPGDLELRCWVNDTLMQHGNTRDMIFTVPHILSYISTYLTLEPGDIVATGTPEGSGAFRTPPRFLEPGDRVRMEIGGIGVIDNAII